jgi:hypothetical protein
MKSNVVLSKSELALVINNLTMLKQVDGCFQGDGMTKLYEDLNNAYDRMNDPIYKRLDTMAKEIWNTDECDLQTYDDAYEAAKELLIEDIKYQF